MIARNNIPLLNIQDTLTSDNETTYIEVMASAEQISHRWHNSYESILKEVADLNSAYQKQAVAIEQATVIRNIPPLVGLLKYLTLKSYQHDVASAIDHLANNYCKLLVADTEKSLEKTIDKSIERTSMAYISLFNDKLRANSDSEQHSARLNKLSLLSNTPITERLEDYCRISGEECDQNIKEVNDEIERYEQEMAAATLGSGFDFQT